MTRLERYLKRGTSLKDVVDDFLSDCAILSELPTRSVDCPMLSLKGDMADLGDMAAPEVDAEGEFGDALWTWIGTEYDPDWIENSVRDRESDDALDAMAHGGM